MTGTPTQHAKADNVRLRSAKPQDYKAIMRLYDEGLLTGTHDPEDPIDDLVHLRHTYLATPRHHFWVAQIDDRVVGMVGLIDVGGAVARIRRLRVDPPWQETDLPCQLIQVALRYGQAHGYLKIILDTHAHVDRKMRFLTDLGFQHAGSRCVNGKTRMAFYVNLYREAQPPGTKNQTSTQERTSKG
jgi:N-acetylglutamate synthase-like GNAT family acetyltransferase